jgi:hypothetical protein
MKKRRGGSMKPSHHAVTLSLCAIVAVLFFLSAADKLHLGKAEGTAWTFIPADIAVEP